MPGKTMSGRGNESPEAREIRILRRAMRAQNKRISRLDARLKELEKKEVWRSGVMSVISVVWALVTGLVGVALGHLWGNKK